MYESMILSTKNFLRTILKFLKLGLKKLSKNSKNRKTEKNLVVGRLEFAPRV